MGAVQTGNFDDAERMEQYGDTGRAQVLNVGGKLVVRSILEPGWSWVEDIKPLVEGLENCPLHHHEYVVAGRIRYDTVEGDTIEAGPGTYLDIEPGHLASVVGDETCIVIDFDEDWGEEGS
ncbi:MAG: cupin [Actinomycetota bacterium]